MSYFVPCTAEIMVKLNTDEVKEYMLVHKIETMNQAAAELAVQEVKEMSGSYQRIRNVEAEESQIITTP